jgi:hypothetical protein
MFYKNKRDQPYVVGKVRILVLNQNNPYQKLMGYDNSFVEAKIFPPE